MSHRCKEMEEAEGIAQIVRELPTSAVAISITSIDKDQYQYLLQLCGVNGELHTLISFCPYCGIRVNRIVARVI